MVVVVKVVDMSEYVGVGKESDEKLESGRSCRECGREGDSFGQADTAVSEW